MEELIFILLIVCGVFAVYCLLHVIACHIVLIRHFIFGKEYDKKTVMTAIYSCIPSVTLYVIFRLIKERYIQKS